MTDEQIIESLRCCQNGFCTVCPNKNCTDDLFELTLDFINRKDTQIKNLKGELKAMRGAANSYKMALEKDQKVIERQEAKIRDKQSEIDCMKYKFAVLKEKIKNQKSEVIKAFSERLKSISIGLEIGDDKKIKVMAVSTLAIDNIAKEMTEESE